MCARGSNPAALVAPDELRSTWVRPALLGGPSTHPLEVMTSTLLRLSLSGAYLVILYFFVLPLAQRPLPAHAWGNVLVILFCLCNIISFWIVAPKPLRVGLGSLNALLGVATLLAIFVAFGLGRVILVDAEKVVPFGLYFLTFIPLVEASNQLRLGGTSASHDL